MKKMIITEVEVAGIDGSTAKIKFPDYDGFCYIPRSCLIDPDQLRATYGKPLDDILLKVKTGMEDFICLILDPPKEPEPAPLFKVGDRVTDDRDRIGTVRMLRPFNSHPYLVEWDGAGSGGWWSDRCLSPAPEKEPKWHNWMEGGKEKP